MKIDTIEELNQDFRQYITQEAEEYFTFLTKNEICPLHECTLDLTPDLHIECGVCREEAMTHQPVEKFLYELDEEETAENQLCNGQKETVYDTRK